MRRRHVHHDTVGEIFVEGLVGTATFVVGVGGLCVLVALVAKGVFVIAYWLFN